MLRILAALTVLGAAAPAFAGEPHEAVPSEHLRVVAEACGARSDAKCLSELRKVCHTHLTFRCYYSRKDRLDAVVHVGFPVERAHSFDE